MGCMRFKRLVPVEGSILNDYQFDSNAQRSLSMALGTDPKRFELKVVKEDDSHTKFEVHAAGHPFHEGDVRPMLLRGHLTYEKPAARYARQD